jgi:hypothetical protein
MKGLNFYGNDYIEPSGGGAIIGKLLSLFVFVVVIMIALLL